MSAAVLEALCEQRQTEQSQASKLWSCAWRRPWELQGRCGVAMARPGVWGWLLSLWMGMMASVFRQQRFQRCIPKWLVSILQQSRPSCEACWDGEMLRLWLPMWLWDFCTMYNIGSLTEDMKDACAKGAVKLGPHASEVTLHFLPLMAYLHSENGNMESWERTGCRWDQRSDWKGLIYIKGLTYLEQIWINIQCCGKH